MFEKILIPVDGSPRAEAILRQLARLLRGREAQYVFVHAIEPVLGYPGVDVSGLVERDRADAKAYFNDLSNRLAAENVRLSAVVREGAPADVVLAAAREQKADLIAMTTHGRSGLARWALGSVAEKVLRRAEVPVFLSRSFRAEGAGWTPAPPEESPFRRLLLPTDGSGIAEAALPAAAAVARAFGAEIAALHVIPARTPLVMGRGVPPIPVPDPAAGEKVAGALAARLADRKIRTRALGAVGDPAEAILDAAASLGADLIVMSTHGRGGLARAGLGSVTERVLRGSTVPMLVVRAAKDVAKPARGKRSRKVGAPA